MKMTSIKYGLLSLVVLVVPLFASADGGGFLTDIPASLKSVQLQLSLGGKPLTKGTINVAQNMAAQLNWTTAQGTKGCVNNWDTQTSPSGSSQGNFTTSRYFIITCYGLGSAQTAKLRVNVVYPDLTITSLKISGLEPVMVAGKAKKNTYKAKNPAYTLHASIKNTGALPVTRGFKVGFEHSTDKKVFTAMTDMTKDVSSLEKNTPLIVNASRNEGSQPTTAHYFRAFVDSETDVGEGTREDNNYSRVIGPFFFE